MTLVILDTLGRLAEFRRVPPQRTIRDPAPAAPPRRDALFEAAGMNLSAFTPVTPQWAPRDFADTRAAWEGPLADAAGSSRAHRSSGVPRPPHLDLHGRPVVAPRQHAAARAIDARKRCSSVWRRSSSSGS